MVILVFPLNRESNYLYVAYKKKEKSLNFGLVINFLSFFSRKIQDGRNMGHLLYVGRIESLNFERLVEYILV